MSFCTTVNCMDGRIQLAVIHYLMDYFQVEYVDSITEPGPVLAFDEPVNAPLVKSILRRLDISIEKHNSVGLAIVAHYDCAGNPQSKEVQLDQLSRTIDYIKKHYPDLKIVGLWVDEIWQVHKVFN